MIRNPSSATDALNVELDAHGDLRTRYGYKNKAPLPPNTLSLVEYIQEGELIAFTVNGPHKLVDDDFQLIPYSGAADVPTWTVAPSTSEYRGVLYFSDPDGVIPLFKYDGNTFYRAGVPAPKVLTKQGDDIPADERSDDPNTPDVIENERINDWKVILKYTDFQGNTTFGSVFSYQYENPIKEINLFVERHNETFDRFYSGVIKDISETEFAVDFVNPLDSIAAYRFSLFSYQRDFIEATTAGGGTTVNIGKRTFVSPFPIASDVDGAIRGLSYGIDVIRSNLATAQTALTQGVADARGRLATFRTELTAAVGNESRARTLYNNERENPSEDDEDILEVYRRALTQAVEARKLAEANVQSAEEQVAFLSSANIPEGSTFNLETFVDEVWLTPTRVEGNTAYFTYEQKGAKYYTVPFRLGSNWQIVLAGKKQDEFNYTTYGENYLERQTSLPFESDYNITNKGLVGQEEGVPLLDIYDDTRLKSLWPIVRYIAIHNNILVGGNAPLQIDSRTEVDVGSDQTIYWSDLALGSSVETWVSDDFLPIGESRDGPVRGLYSEQNNLAVFKERQIYIVSGILATRQFRVSSLQTNGIGCISHRSIHEMQGGCVFISRRGFHLLMGNGQITELSDPIEPRFVDGKRDWANSLVAHSLLDEKFYIRVSDEIYVYDYYHKEWFLFKDIPAQAGIVAMGNDLFYGGTESLYVRSDDMKDEGRYFKSFWESGWFGLERPGQRKKAQRYYVLGKGEWSGRVDFFFDFDDEVEHSSNRDFTGEESVLRIVKRNPPREGRIGKMLHINSVPFGKEVGDPLFIKFRITGTIEDEDCPSKETGPIQIRGIGVEGDVNQITIRPGLTLVESS